MENLNRLKAVLADSGKTNKWLAEQMGKFLTLCAAEESCLLLKENGTVREIT